MPLITVGLPIGDNYANYFISNTGNSVSSTLGFLVNGVNLALESV